MDRIPSSSFRERTAKSLPADLDSHLDLIRNAAIVLAQLEIPLSTVEHLAEITQHEGVPLMLDPAPARPLPDSLFQRIDWITPNESETATLLGTTGIDWNESRMKEAASALLDRGPKNVILKLGERGCYLALADGSREFVPAFKVRACGYHCGWGRVQRRFCRSHGWRQRSCKQRRVGVGGGGHLRNPIGSTTVHAEYR